MRYATRLVVPRCVFIGACSLAGPGSAAPAKVLTDANINARILAASTAEIRYAALALATSQDARVLACTTMVTIDHDAINRAVLALVTGRSITPADNQRAIDLHDAAETQRRLFRALAGGAFDSAYIFQ